MEIGKTTHVATARDILDAGVRKFEVVNGAWIGEIKNINEEPWLDRYDFNGKFVNAVRLSKNYRLDLIIKPIEIVEFSDFFRFRTSKRDKKIE